MNEQYTGPDVEVGEIVNWYPGGNPNVEPIPAIVTRLGCDNICVNIVDPSLHNFILRDGVYHIDNELARRPETVEAGGWDRTPLTKKLVDLAEQFQPAGTK